MFTDSQPSDQIPVPEGATPVESHSGKIIGWTKTRIVRNGSPRHYDVEWSLIIKLFAGTMLALGGTGIVSTVALYREVGMLSAMLATSQAQIERMTLGLVEHEHLLYHPGVYQHFITKEEYYRDRAQQKGR